jgi:hypothetical protein
VKRWAISGPGKSNVMCPMLGETSWSASTVEEIKEMLATAAKVAVYRAERLRDEKRIVIYVEDEAHAILTEELRQAVQDLLALGGKSGVVVELESEES